MTTRRKSNRKYLVEQNGKRKTIRKRIDYTNQTMNKIREVIAEPWDDLKAETTRMLDQGVPIEEIIWFLPGPQPADIAARSPYTPSELNASYVDVREAFVSSFEQCGRDDLVKIVRALPEAAPRCLLVVYLGEHDGILAMNMPVFLLVGGVQLFDRPILSITPRGVSLLRC